MFIFAIKHEPNKKNPIHILPVHSSLSCSGSGALSK